MFRSTLLVVVVATLAGINAQTECHIPYVHYDFVQPTFDYARALGVALKPEFSILHTADRKFGPILQLEDDLCLYDPDNLTDAANLGSSATTHINKAMGSAPGVSIITYANERQRLSSFIDSKKGFDNLETCHQVITTRAFELWTGGLGDRAIGFDQGNMGCLIKYKPGTFANLSDSAFAEVNIVNSERFSMVPTRYKISASWAYSVRDSGAIVKFGLLDEAGFVYMLDYYGDAGSSIDSKLISIRTLSAINLEPDDEYFKFSSPHRSERVAVDMPKDIEAAGLPAPEGPPYENMKMHYDHAFVEAITIADGSLCWSTGTGTMAQWNLLRCFGPTSRPAPLPRGILDRIQRGLSIRALEAYEFKGKMHLHLVYVQWNGDDKIGTMLNYNSLSYLHMQDNSWASLSQQQFEPTRPTANGSLTPIDIVYLAECEKVAVFYQHMYTLHNPAETIEFHAKREYNLVAWMNYPLNAVLYQNKRLYLFTSGNGMLVSKELSVSGGDSCGLNNVEIDANYFQSQMLLNYDDQLKRSRRASRWPVYNSRGYKTTRNETISEWHPNLKEWMTAPIPEKHSLKADPRDVGPDPGPTPAPEPTPGPTPKPRPAPGNSTSIIIVIIIVVIIIGIVCGSVYYFCCGTPDEPIRRPKSAMRKFKTLGGPTTSGQQTLNQPVGSTLHPHETVRSGLQSTASKQGSNATAMTKPLSKSGQKTISETPKTIRAGEPPVSIKSVKSKRSPGPANSPKSRRSQKTSPKPSSTSAKKPSPAPPSPAASLSGKKSSANLNSASKKSSPGANLVAKKSIRSPSSPNSSPRSPNPTPSPK